jgi:hypothetical protein
MTVVLFARKDSIYKQLGCDVYDIDRDARTWEGGAPCICHPPCRAWGQLRHMAKPRQDEKQLAVYSIDQIRKYGGILEHPRGSTLWDYLDLPKGNQTDSFGGYSICVDQHDFGHKARKRSLLYIVGVQRQDLPNIPIQFDAIEYTVSSKIKKYSGRRTKKEITKKEREATHDALAKWLVRVCEIIHSKRTL